MGSTTLWLPNLLLRIVSENIDASCEQTFTQDNDPISKTKYLAHQEMCVFGFRALQFVLDIFSTLIWLQWLQLQPNLFCSRISTLFFPEMERKAFRSHSLQVNCDQKLNSYLIWRLHLIRQKWKLQTNGLIVTASSFIINRSSQYIFH